MTELFTLDNLIAWVAQTTILIGAAALLGRVARVQAPRLQLLLLQILLLACLVLPALQQWRHPIYTMKLAAPKPGMAEQSRPYSPSGAVIYWVDLAPYALAMGCAGRLIWLCFGMSRLRRFRRSARLFEPTPQAVSAALSLTNTQAEFGVSNEICGPVTFGLRAPVVLVPPAFSALPAAQQLAIATHELTHVKRRDWILSLIEELTAAALWFHPAVWWLMRQIRLTREQVVDIEVIQLTGARQDYIDALLAVAQTRWQLDLAPAPLFLRRRHLMNRIQQLLKETTMSRKRIIASYASIFAMLAGTAWLGFTSFPLTAEPQFQPAPKAKANPVLENIDMSRLPEPNRVVLKEKLANYVGQPVTNELMRQISQDARMSTALSLLYG